MKKILLIEDDLILVQMYEIKFKHAGFIVETAFDGRQGIEKMRSFKPDLVLLDIVMPKLNGKVLFGMVRNNPELKHIPIAILTNIDNPKDKEEFLERGAVGFFIKANMTPAQIVDQVSEILSH